MFSHKYEVGGSGSQISNIELSVGKLRERVNDFS